MMNSTIAMKKIALAISMETPAIPPKPQNAGDQGDNQEGDDPAQHDKLRNLDSRADATCADAFDEIIAPGNKGSGRFKASRKRKISPGKEQIAGVSRAA